MAKYQIETIENGGLKLEVCNLGGTIMKLLTPDAKGTLADVVLGYSTPSDYIKNDGYFGALIGRYCNRIGGAKCVIDGKKYKLDANDGANTLHGGKNSFESALWDMRLCEGDGWKGANLHYICPDMLNGFPGNLEVSVFYKLTDNAELVLEYFATTDKPTVCALTNHTYFDLSAGASGDILDHYIKINSDFFTPPNNKLIPTGEILEVKGTPLDLRKFKKIRDGVEAESKLIVEVNGGFDHNFVLKNSDGGMVQAAVVHDPVSGRSMEVLTNEPGVQFYTGNFITKRRGKDGRIYNRHSGFCLETQHWPDSPNQPHFPSTVLYPGETYYSSTIYRFGALR